MRKAQAGVGVCGWGDGLAKADDRVFFRGILTISPSQFRVISNFQFVIFLKNQISKILKDQIGGGQAQML